MVTNTNTENSKFLSVLFTAVINGSRNFNGFINEERQLFGVYIYGKGSNAQVMLFKTQVLVISQIIDGVISIYEVDARSDQQVPNTKCLPFTIDQLHQVIYGRLSERGENYQVSFIIECRPTK